MPMRNTFPLLLLIGIFFTGPCYSLEELEADKNDTDLISVEKETWKEGDVVIPAFPQSDDLIKVEIDKGEQLFNFYIDAKNLSALPKQGVTRYTVVIESDSGAKNVLFEGIRCQTREYKTYAYGTYDNKLSKAITSEWKLIREADSMTHRYNFYRYYLCSEYLIPNPLDIVLQKIKYPENFQVSDERDD